MIAALSVDAAMANPSLKPLRIVGIDPTPESLASFDCARAELRVERMICQDRWLAREDRSLAQSYWILSRRLEPNERAELRQAQRTWLQKRNACKGESCVSSAYESRQAELDAALLRRNEQLRASVSRVGQCQVTQIESIGPRLELVEGEPPNGTSITFANAVTQYSYDREPIVLQSRVGDRARVCLVSIPHGCPPGDERGRIYEVSNLRTGNRWRLPDSSHSCGGA